MRIRIRMDPHSFDLLDPDPGVKNNVKKCKKCKKKCKKCKKKMQKKGEQLDKLTNNLNIF